MLREILLKKREDVIRDWLGRVLSEYPPRAGEFFGREKDPIANPVGANIAASLASLYDALVAGEPIETMREHALAVVRITAVQELSPGRAAGFAFGLKSAVRKALAGEPGLAAELVELEERVDELVLLSFDLYSECREKIFSIKANEIRERSKRLLKMANLTMDFSCPAGPGGD